MATLDEEKNISEAFEANLDAITKITPESLVRRDDLGTTLNFEEGLPYFRRTLKLFNDMKNSNKDGIPYDILNELNNLAVNAIEEFKKIKDFSPDKNPQNPKSTRDQLINAVRDRYVEYYRKLTPHIAYAIRKGTDFEALEKQARDSSNELIKLKGDIIDDQKKSKIESDKILDSMRKAAAEVGVSQHAIYFKAQADEHIDSSKKWLKATYWLAIGTIVYAIAATIVYFIFQKDLDINHSIQLGIAKILVFSALYYATIWCGKNYRAQLHNYIMNKHRQNSLGTFEAFVKATNDEATKNAVLLRSTEAIFNSGQSGFVSSEQESSGSPQILEIIRAGLGKKTE